MSKIEDFDVDVFIHSIGDLNEKILAGQEDNKFLRKKIRNGFLSSLFLLVAIPLDDHMHNIPVVGNKESQIEQVYITIENLNLRKYPGTYSSILGVFEKGSCIKKVERAYKKGWGEVFDNKKDQIFSKNVSLGYVSLEYLRPVKAGTADDKNCFIKFRKR